MTLTKAELINALAKNLEFPRLTATEIVEQFFEEIRIALENGEDVKLSGLGKFQLRDKNERPGRNPKTGEDTAICARRVVSFKAGQKLKQTISALPIEDFQTQTLI